MKSTKFSTVFALFVVCLTSVVLAKNVDNPRSKRAAEENSCESVRQFFSVKNITMPSSKAKGSICSGQCCDDKTEALLRKQGQKDFADLLRHNSRSLQGLLTSTATTLQNHVSELARQSENKTLLLFWQVYRGMAVLSRKPIENLYREIMNYVVIDSAEAKATASAEEIVAGVTLFFTELFPLAYHHSADISNKDFTLNYKECLKKSIDYISPFGDIPKQIAQSLSKSLEATRLLLQAFRIGSEVLNTTDTLLIDEHSAAGNSECHTALVKMTYCPKCMGLRKNTKPCSGYCLNVLRGCITKYVAELDLPWNGYVEGIESLLNAMKRGNNEAGVNADAVIRNLDTKISAAIMHYMANAKEIDDRVKKTCGSAEFSQKEDPLIAETSTLAPTPSSGKPRTTNPRNFSPLPENELSHFLSAIGKTKGFYANLANTLCQDESFAERKDKQCWNGERIAEYTKTVVDVGLDMQKYNPEVKPNTNIQSVDPKVANLVDKLQRVHHMAISSLGSNYSDADYMQGDGAEGSGSGSGPDIEEDDRDDEYVRGSGSGGGPGQDEENGKSDDSRSAKEPSSGTGIKIATNDQTPTVTIVGSGGSNLISNCLVTPMLSLTIIVLPWRFY